jgi:hypothetical protein
VAGQTEDTREGRETLGSEELAAILKEKVCSKGFFKRLDNLAEMSQN